MRRLVKFQRYTVSIGRFVWRAARGDGNGAVAAPTRGTQPLEGQGKPLLWLSWWGESYGPAPSLFQQPVLAKSLRISGQNVHELLHEIVSCEPQNRRRLQRGGSGQRGNRVSPEWFRRGPSDGMLVHEVTRCCR